MKNDVTLFMSDGISDRYTIEQISLSALKQYQVVSAAPIS